MHIQRPLEDIQTDLLVPFRFVGGDEGRLGALCIAAELELDEGRLFPTGPVEQLSAFDGDGDEYA